MSEANREPVGLGCQGRAGDSARDMGQCWGGSGGPCCWALWLPSILPIPVAHHC